MVSDIKQPALVPIQGIYRREELIQILGICDNTFRDIDRWNHGWVSLEQLISYLRKHGVSYELVP